MTPARALRQPLALLLTLLFLFQVIPSPVPSASAAEAGAGDHAIQALVQHILTYQADDGSFRHNDLGRMHTPWVIQALVASGLDPDEMRTGPGKPSAIDWLRDHRLLYDPTKPTDWESQILAIVAAGEDPYDFGDHDYVQSLRLHAWQGQMGRPDHVNDDIFGLLALRAAGVPVSDPLIRGMRDHVLGHQCPDGTWSWTRCSDTGSIDTTGAALAGLAAAGVPRDNTAIQRALDRLHAEQLPSGAFPSAVDQTAANLQSTAWAVWGLRTTGEDPWGPGWTTEAGGTPLGWLAEQGEHEKDLWRARDTLLALAAPSLPVHPPKSAPVEPPVDRPPIARLAASEHTTNRNTTLEFDARASTDPEEGPLSFQWRVGERILADWGASPVLRHHFLEPGTFTVTVDVRDDLEQAASAHVNVEVLNRAPTLRVPSGLQATRIDAVAWNLTRAADPDGDTLTWQWDFGDGNTSRNPSPAHRYERLGNYTVTAHVADPFGGAAEASFPVEVRNLPPRLVLSGPTRLPAGEPANFTADAVDPDGPAPSVTWLAGGPNVTFDTPGDHEVRAAAVDADGARVERLLTVQVTPRDARGNNGTAETPPDARAPEVLGLHTDPPEPQPGAPFHAVADVANHTPVAAITFTWPGGRDRVDTAPWRVTVPGLPPGTHEIVAIAESPSGHRAGQSLEVRLVEAGRSEVDVGPHHWEAFDARVNLTLPERAHPGEPIAVVAVAPDDQRVEVWTSTGLSWQGEGRVEANFTPTLRGPVRVWARAEADDWATSQLVLVEAGEPEAPPATGQKLRAADLLPAPGGNASDAPREAPLFPFAAALSLLLAATGLLRRRPR